MTLVQTELKSMKIWQASRLPSEYQEVEYIQSSGTQYLAPGVTHSAGDTIKVEADIYIKGNGAIYSQYTGWTPIFNMFQLGIDNDAFFARMNANDNGTLPTTWTPSTYTINTRYNVVAEGQTSINQKAPLLLATNDQNDSVSWYMSAKLYSFKIRKNGTLVRELVPCYRKSDDVIGMYDLVNKVFYTNQGTGTFTKGNDQNTSAEKEIKRITIRKQEEQTTTIYGPSSEVYGNVNIYSDTAPSDGIYNFSAEVSAVSGYYGCIGIIINGATVETFRTGSTSYVSFTYQTTLNAGDSIVLYLYGEPNQNAGCRNVQIDTVAIDRTEKQIRPVQWQPGANTLAYYTFNNTLDDSSGNGRGLTNSGISFQIEDNINCAYCDGGSYAYCQTIPTPSVITINIWAKATNDRSGTYARNLFHTKLASARQNGLIGVRWEFYSGLSCPAVGVGTSGNVGNEQNALLYSTVSYNDICNRNLWTCVYDNVTYKLSIYRNGQLVSEDTFSTYHPTGNWCDKFSIGVGYVPGNSPTRYWKGWVSETIIEDKVRTAQEVSNYYNQTKGIYGL